MSIIQLLLLAGGMMALMVVGYLVVTGKSPSKESHRRLQAVRYRHSENTLDKVESQLKKAIAARKPKAHRVAGSKSRSEALAIRLDRTGKGWTVSQYMYTSLGIAVTVAALLFFKTGAALLALGIGILVGAGLPHLAVNFFIKKRTNNFNSNSPNGSSFSFAACVQAFRWPRRSASFRPKFPARSARSSRA